MSVGVQHLGSIGGVGQSSSGVQSSEHRSVFALLSSEIPSLGGGGRCCQAMSWIGHGVPSGNVVDCDWKAGHCHTDRSSVPKVVPQYWHTWS